MSAAERFIRRGLVQFDVSLLDEDVVCVFRLPTIEDFAALDEHLPMIAARDAREPGAEDPSPAAMQLSMRRARELLLRLSVEPKLVDDPQPTDGTQLFVGALRSSDLLAIAATLRGLSGLGGAGAARLRPFSATAGCSRSATSSGDGTAVGPTSS